MSLIGSKDYPLNFRIQAIPNSVPILAELRSPIPLLNTTQTTARPDIKVESILIFPHLSQRFIVVLRAC